MLETIMNIPVSTLDAPQLWSVRDAEQRKLFHQTMAEWMAMAEEADFERIEVLREQLAPGEVCSMLKLMRLCLARSEFQAQLPEALVALLRARSLLRPCAVEPSPAAAAGRH